MFTGIIESTALVTGIEKEGTNIHFALRSDIAPELKVDQSVSHNGVCLTVTWRENNQYRVTAIDETLNKTNLGLLKVSDYVNIERCMKADGRFDGHIVQGHVDETGKCENIEDADGSTIFTFSFNSKSGNLTVEKGSITINGVSLTVFNSSPGQFSVAIIPYTLEHTGFKFMKQGDTVNLEFDILGKYISAILAQRGIIK